MPKETTKIHFANAQIGHQSIEAVVRLLEKNRKTLNVPLAQEDQMMVKLQAVQTLVVA